MDRILLFLNFPFDHILSGLGVEGRNNNNNPQQQQQQQQ